MTDLPPRRWPVFSLSKAEQRKEFCINSQKITPHFSTFPVNFPLIRCVQNAKPRGVQAAGSKPTARLFPWILQSSPTPRLTPRPCLHDDATVVKWRARKASSAPAARPCLPPRDPSRRSSLHARCAHTTQTAGEAPTETVPPHPTTLGSTQWAPAFRQGSYVLHK